MTRLTSLTKRCRLIHYLHISSLTYMAQYSFRIPRFRVDDDSSVTVVETKTSFEKSMADSSFSETSFQVAALVTSQFFVIILGPVCTNHSFRSGGFFGVSLGVKVGGAQSSSDDSSSLKAREESSLVVNYNVGHTITQEPHTHSNPSIPA